MFDISENGKEAVVSYLKKTFGEKRNRELCRANKENMQNSLRNKSNLLLTKSLIVK